MELVVIAGGRSAEPISLANKPKSYQDCEHKQVEVDEMLAMVSCKVCKKELNPMAVLAMLAKEESRLGRQIEEMKVIRQRIDEKIRCKCMHCGKMTPVRT